MCSHSELILMIILNIPLMIIHNIPLSINIRRKSPEIIPKRILSAVIGIFLVRDSRMSSE